MKKILILLLFCLFNSCYENIDLNTYDDNDKYNIKNYVIPNYVGIAYDKNHHAMYLYGRDGNVENAYFKYTIYRDGIIQEIGNRSFSSKCDTVFFNLSKYYLNGIYYIDATISDIVIFGLNTKYEYKLDNIDLKCGFLIE